MNSIEIKSLRKKLGLSQQVFATRLGVGIMTVHRWEKGTCKPSHLALEKLFLMKNELCQK
jgi:DNA-binding transcriptional regulator YiaG